MGKVRGGAGLAVAAVVVSLVATTGAANAVTSRANPAVHFNRQVVAAPRVAPSTGPGSTVPFFGLAVPQANVAAVPGLANIAGESPSVFNIFTKLDSPITTAKFTSVADAGMTPFVTLEPWSYKSQGVNQPSYTLASIYQGAHDADFRRIAGVLAQAKIPMYFRFAHEMNAWWYPWAASQNGNKPGDYVKAWVHVHDLFVAAGATNLRWVFSPNIEVPGRTTPLSELLPPAGYYDLVGVSCYAHSGTATSACGPTLTKLQSMTNARMVLSEVGADGASKASWIRSLTTLFSAHPRLAGFIWFNTTPQTTGASGYYTFNDSATDIAAFRAMLAGR